MTTLLVIDSSARRERSHTRRLTRLFAERWRALRPRDQIVHRDLGAAPPPPVDADWVAAAYTPQEQRTERMRRSLATSDALLDELERSDVVVLGAPMYNFGMPAQLKAWVDQVVRVGRTFSFDPASPAEPYRPLLRGKTVVLVTSRGDRGFGPGGPLAHMNHLDRHVETVFRFIGVERVETIAVESDEWDDEHLVRSLGQATREVERLARELAATPAARDGAESRLEDGTARG
ncbi:MAG: NAD(P)H-dependent oxidoreductase [Thermodesulfobacteriota bacterium]